MKSKILKIFSVILAMMFMAFCFTSCKEKEYEKTDDPEITTEESTTEPPLPANINPLTGLEMDEAAAGKRPVAIMVENSPAARPQWGLSTPDIVLEGVVEGGITRMMWIYADVNKMPKVGPVRSARHDYFEIAYGMGAIFAHWGWSKPAENMIKKVGYDNINGPAGYFFKDTNRNTATEHRGYTTGENLQSYFAKANIKTEQTKENWAPYSVILKGERIPFESSTAGTCTSITVTFSSSYKHTFKYDMSTGLYKNYMNTSEMKDGNNGEQMAVKNVIVMYASVTGYKGSDGEAKHREWDLSKGEALYITNGYGEKITWEKGNASNPLKFYGQDGKELTINKGQTWIGVVPVANKDLTKIETQ